MLNYAGIVSITLAICRDAKAGQLSRPFGAKASGSFSTNNNMDVFLNIAREFRDIDSLSRAARFYEFAIEHSTSPPWHSSHAHRSSTSATDDESARSGGDGGKPSTGGESEEQESQTEEEQAAQAKAEAEEERRRLQGRGRAHLELGRLVARDPSLSQNYSYLELYMEAADLGIAEAQHTVATWYSTGVAAKHLVPMDAGRALLLEYLAALGGHPLAHMGMGYRYLQGVGVPQSCELALPFYEQAANHAAEVILRTGRAPSPDRLRLSEAADPHATWLKRDGTTELTDYYAHLADTGTTQHNQIT